MKDLNHTTKATPSKEIESLRRKVADREKIITEQRHELFIERALYQKAKTEADGLKQDLRACQSALNALALTMERVSAPRPDQTVDINLTPRQ